MSKKIAIVYHSGFGHTAVVAEHVAKGARAVPGVEAALYKAEDLSKADQGPWADLAASDAIIFGAPTYMGSASAQFKQFADASSKVSLWAEGHGCCRFPDADKLNTLFQFAVLAAPRPGEARLVAPRHEASAPFGVPEAGGITVVHPSQRYYS